MNAGYQLFDHICVYALPGALSLQPLCPMQLRLRTAAFVPYLFHESSHEPQIYLSSK